MQMIWMLHGVVILASSVSSVHSFQALRPSLAFSQPQYSVATLASLATTSETTNTSQQRTATALKLVDQSSSSNTEPPEVSSSTEPIASMFRMLFRVIGSTTSLLVAGTFFIVLAWKRDALMVSFFIGAIANGILSKVLKKILKQERPAELDTTEMKLKPSDNGMPSSHAMSLGFIGTFTALMLPWSRIPLSLYVITSLLYRIETNLHSRDQIVVGLILGSLNGALWKIALCDGTNPWNVNMLDLVSKYCLNEAGVLPWSMLAFPAIVGAMVVGSIERRISGWLKKTSNKED